MKRPLRWLDELVASQLQKWPNHPPGLPHQMGNTTWLRARPGVVSHHNPFLKLPGSDRLKTLPDGLWLNFGGTPLEPFVDIFAIEACGNLQNLLDKRSRFAPSVQSLLAVCPLPWLLDTVGPNDATPRWRAIGLLKNEPTTPLILPVRDLRVMYGLKRLHYVGFAQSQIPHPHEYFVTMEALIAEDSHENPNIRELVSRAAPSANFLPMT